MYVFTQTCPNLPCGEGRRMSAQKRPVRDVASRGVGVKVQGGMRACMHTDTHTHIHADMHTGTSAHIHTHEVCADFGMALSAPQTQFLPHGRKSVRKCKVKKRVQPYMRKHRGCWVFRTLSSKQGPSGTSVAAPWSQVLPFTAASLLLITLNP